jgi:hypothetical protein
MFGSVALTMADKTQQQTLSIRITDSMRRRLERARLLAESKTGEPVSTSEIAKQFLESARGDRMELVDLLAEPTESLLQIRRKGEAGHVLSRAEWTVLAYFIQVGVESATRQVPTLISTDAVVAVFDAFLAVYALRTSDEEGLDDYYLGNLPREHRPTATGRSSRPQADIRDVVSRAVRAVRDRARDQTAGTRPGFAARNLYVLLDGDRLPGAEDLSRALRPLWPRLWRLAARGHYIRTGRPIRESDVEHEGLYQTPIPSIREGDYTLNFARGAGTEFSLLLEFPPARGLQYPVVGFPRLAEFRSLVEAIGPSGEDLWSGMQFSGGVMTDALGKPAVWFRAKDNGITVLSSADEWAQVQRLVSRAWDVPDIRRAWDLLTLEYGEL